MKDGKEQYEVVFPAWCKLVDLEWFFVLLSRGPMVFSGGR